MLIFLNACSSVKDAGVVFHDSFDFSEVKSYNLYGRNSAFSETQSLADTRRNAIEIAIEHTMANKNFSYKALDKADVIITYHVFNERRSDFSKYNKLVNFCTQCLRATTWITKRQYSVIEKGSLILDIVDPQKNRSVWRSVYPLGLKEKENSAKTNERINSAVTSMLAQYPQSYLNRATTP